MGQFMIKHIQQQIYDALLSTLQCSDIFNEIFLVGFLCRIMFLYICNQTWNNWVRWFSTSTYSIRFSHHVMLRFGNHLTQLVTTCRSKEKTLTYVVYVALTSIWIFYGGFDVGNELHFEVYSSLMAYWSSVACGVASLERAFSRHRACMWLFCMILR